MPPLLCAAGWHLAWKHARFWYPRSPLCPEQQHSCLPPLPLPLTLPLPRLRPLSSLQMQMQTQTQMQMQGGARTAFCGWKCPRSATRVATQLAATQRFSLTIAAAAAAAAWTILCAVQSLRLAPPPPLALAHCRSAE